MGQRLNLEIHVNNKEGEAVLLANIYYHWSAYTFAAFEELKNVREALTDSMSERHTYKSDQLWIADVLCKGGTVSGVTQDSLDYLKKQDENLVKERINLASNRNEGLLGFSEKDMSSTSDWAEGVAGIIIEDDNSIELYNYVYDEYDNEEEMMDSYCIDSKEELNEEYTFKEFVFEEGTAFIGGPSSEEDYDRFENLFDTMYEEKFDGFKVNGTIYMPIA